MDFDLFVILKIDIDNNYQFSAWWRSSFLTSPFFQVIDYFSNLENTQVSCHYWFYDNDFLYKHELMFLVWLKSNVFNFLHDNKNYEFNTIRKKIEINKNRTGSIKYHLSFLEWIWWLKRFVVRQSCRFVLVVRVTFLCLCNSVPPLWLNKLFLDYEV